MCEIKLVWRAVIQADEIHIALAPVVIDVHTVVVRVVTLALLANHRRVEPVGKLFEQLITRLWRVEFVIAHAQKNRQVSERQELVGNEVFPGGVFVVQNRHGMPEMLWLVKDVFVEGVDRSKVAELPIELRAMLQYVSGNHGHHHVAAVA